MSEDTELSAGQQDRAQEPRKYVFPAVIWLVVVGFATLILYVFSGILDTAATGGNIGLSIALIGGVVGLAPLLTVLALMKQGGPAGAPKVIFAKHPRDWSRGERVAVLIVVVILIRIVRWLMSH